MFRNRVLNSCRIWSQTGLHTPHPLLRYRVLNSCRIWSQTGLHTPHPLLRYRVLNSCRIWSQTGLHTPHPLLRYRVLNSCRIWSQTGLHTPHPLPVTHCLYCDAGKGRKGKGRVEPERRLEGQQFTKMGRKYQNDWLYLQSINSDKHLPQSPFTGQLF